jgi:hypothetical protein
LEASVSALVQVIKYKTYAVKACGRACPDMQPSTLPVIPPPPPVSLAEILRAHPNLVLDPDGLADMETSDTIH